MAQVVSTHHIATANGCRVIQSLIYKHSESRLSRNLDSWAWRAWLLVPSKIRRRAYELTSNYARKHWNGATTLYVTKLPWNIYVKTSFNAMEETAATRYVEEKTSIPVPHIVDYVALHDDDYPGMGIIVMKPASGHHLGKKGEVLRQLSKVQQEVFFQTLKGWLDELRDLPPPDDHTICGFLGNGLFSYRIGDVLEGPRGPFTSQEEFHAQDFCTPWPSSDELVSRALERRTDTLYKTCLTHGDLIPDNILVDDSARPVALIDWETASWMPEYWEYTRALYMRAEYVGWRLAFDRIFPNYGPELVVESAIWRHWVPS